MIRPSMQEQLDREAEEAQSLREEFWRREQEFIKEREARILREAELRAQYEAVQKRASKKARQRKKKAAKRSSSPEFPKDLPGKKDKGKRRRDKSASRTTKSQKRKKSEERERPQKYRQASAKLPQGSRLSRAMRVGGPGGSDSSSDESDSSSSTDESRWKLPEIPTSSDEDSASDFFPEEPDSVHSSDSEPTKSARRHAKRRYKEAMVKIPARISQGGPSICVQRRSES